MKKLMAFVMALVMVLSITAVSLASITKTEDYLKPFCGAWMFKREYSGKKDNYILIIGKNTEYNMYTAQLINNWYDNDGGTTTSSNEYSLTYDKDDGDIYLTNSANDVAYKIKIVDDKLLLYRLNGSYNTYERID